MSYFFLVLLFFHSSVVEAAESMLPCRKIEAITLKAPKDNTYKAEHVAELARAIAEESGCDDGVFGEQATEIVCHALVNDFSGIIKYGSADPKARAFVLRHIDATAAESDLVLISRKRGYCFTADSNLCQEIIVQAEKALQSMYKKGRSFDRKPAGR